MFETPILFLIFNRPDTTKQVFEQIKKIKPKYLFIAADGPRQDKEGEAEKCHETRKIVLESIAWDCELKTLFRDENFGCGKAVSSAITWFFDNVEEGIILEDDCLPHLDFFPYCSQLLEFHRNNDKVMFISGDNFQDGIHRGNGSYYYSTYIHVWGWASWRRVWKNYSFSLAEINEIMLRKIMKHYFSKKTERKYWIRIFWLMKQSKIDTWDYQVFFSIWKNKGLSIIPNVNMISNIGFGNEATHTTETNHKLANTPTYNILPIRHPKDIFINKQADKYFFKNNLYSADINNRICTRIKQKIKNKLYSILTQIKKMLNF